MNPQWYRCHTCNETSYIPRTRVEAEAQAAATSGRPRRLYGTTTVPLPVRTDPRTRLVEAVLGFAATGLFVVSIPLAIFLLAGARGESLDTLLRAPGVSLVVTLWIFLGVALTAASLYAALLVFRSKSEAGAGWIALGSVAAVLSAVFVALANVTGGWAGVAGGGLFVAGGIFDTLNILGKR